MKKNLWIFLFAAPALAVLLVSLKFYYLLSVWSYSGEDYILQIKPGETFSKINYRLYKNNLISSAKAFHRYTWLRGSLTKFRTGKFLIKTDSNMFEIYNTLISGQPITKTITIPEGKNLYEIGKLLEAKGITDANEFIKLAKNPAFTKSLGISATRSEGYLYPETYRFSPDSPAGQVIRAMVNQFRIQTKGINLHTQKLDLHQIVTLASVVEKETGAAFERPKIAGVFLNRLNKKMRLQSDPTTIYGVFENFNGNLRKKHLQTKTPYNTYRINGLPKGPICNPGIQSLKAVLMPEQHQYLYFVSQNDGTHIFSKTYREHNQAVTKYQKIRRNRQGKSWRHLKQ